MANVQFTPGMRGSDIVIAQIKKRWKKAVVLFWIMTAIILGMGVTGFLVENYVLVVIAMFFLLPILIPTIIFTVKYTHPMKCRPLKHRPVILKEADWLMENIRFQNDVLIVSDSFFAPPSDLSAIIATQEVLLMYKQTITTNFLTSYFIAVETVRGKTSIPYLRNQEQMVVDTIGAVMQFCPHARLGYNQENINYVEYMRSMWEETQKNQMQR